MSEVRAVLIVWSSKICNSMVCFDEINMIISYFTFSSTVQVFMTLCLRVSSQTVSLFFYCVNEFSSRAIILWTNKSSKSTILKLLDTTMDNTVSTYCSIGAVDCISYLELEKEFFYIQSVQTGSWNIAVLGILQLYSPSKFCCQKLLILWYTMLMH